MYSERNAPPRPRRAQRERRELSRNRTMEAAVTLITRQSRGRTTLSQIRNFERAPKAGGRSA